MVDIPNNNTTTTTIAVGGSVVNTIETVGDHDWIKINLTAGQAITVALNGITLGDPFLQIRDQSGNVIYTNDDVNLGVNLNSLLSFQASYTGVYYIDVGAYQDPNNPNDPYPGSTGDYQVNVTAYQTPPVWTNDQIANQLASGYWGGTAHKFVLDATRTLTVDITGLTPEGQALARAALQTWSQITGITFQETALGTGARITFTDTSVPPDDGAYTSSSYSNGNITHSDINVDVTWLSDYGPNIGGYAYQAYLHEIGHALGLGHAGNYNTTADYPYDALYQNDAWATSVMSYFSQTENTYFSGQGFTSAYVVTPMVADILAIQQLYGLSTTTRSGDTIYGPTGNAGSPYTLANVAYTIFDTGGIDTLDYSQYQSAQTINLNPETFSSVGGERGNVSIARGTVIENAIGGDRADIMIGNSVANTLSGLAGADTLTGGSGSDMFRDTISDHNGDTITDFSLGDAIVFTDAVLASFTFNLTGNTLTYSGGSMTLSGFSGTIVATAAAGGGVQLTIQQAIVQDARNDFNGDGRSDILWRHDDGRITDWLGTANGGFAPNAANSLNGVSVDWQVAATGDFNGDGRDDILWRNVDGRMTDWLGTATGGFADNAANAYNSVATQWHVVGAGDFNGDGRDDILWRHDDGRITDWLGTANGGFAPNSANSLNGVSVDWKIAAIGDFNGDGRDDILWRNVDGRMTDWLGTATGGFTDNAANAYNSVATQWHVVGAGDFNGDGRDDILWRHDDGRITDWLGTANGGFSPNAANSLNGVSVDWQVAAIGDFNGDGRDDILWRNVDGRMTDWLGTATGGFADNAANAYNSVATQWDVKPDIFWV
ncbi:hypothetical protein GCM10023264_04090 [Sphingomonas daechungensis]|uniref:VCBS repeat-containing protein n=1 Tax=Sphingomonas daechungensis TaxID=1176646 RepID=A0ABX6T261_9SPHN|nr:FG-GAP-like repeat-containing protein [Sphingomonas daechungensis]QNP42818.1 VCBS repeat-containing protein [Sphingomonas daechungensis]